jgi:excisionase family DNA binding protein
LIFSEILPDIYLKKYPRITIHKFGEILNTNFIMDNLVLSTKNTNDLVREVADEVVKQLLPYIKVEKDSESDIINLDEAAALLHLAKPTLYSKVCRGELPHMKKGKRLYFSKIELINFIQGGRCKTNEDIENEASSYLKSRKGGAK